MAMLFHTGQDEPIIEWTTVHLLTLWEECEIRYLDMSEEELEQKLDLKNNPGIRTTIKKCRKKYNACKRWIFGKSDESRKKAIATYPDLEGCLLDAFAGVVHTRGNLRAIRAQLCVRKLAQNSSFYLLRHKYLK